MIDLNGVRLRNRVVTSSSLLGYGAPRGRVVLYGLSPFGDAANHPLNVASSTTR